MDKPDKLAFETVIEYAKSIGLMPLGVLFMDSRTGEVAIVFTSGIDEKMKETVREQMGLHILSTERIRTC